MLLRTIDRFQRGSAEQPQVFCRRVVADGFHFDFAAAAGGIDKLDAVAAFVDACLNADAQRIDSRDDVAHGRGNVVDLVQVDRAGHAVRIGDLEVADVDAVAAIERRQKCARANLAALQAAAIHGGVHAVGGDAQGRGRAVRVAVRYGEVARRGAGRVGELNSVASRIDRGGDARRLGVDFRDDVAERFGAAQVDVGCDVVAIGDARGGRACRVRLRLSGSKPVNP